MSYSNSTELQGIKFLSRVSEKTASQPQADYVVRRGGEITSGFEKQGKDRKFLQRLLEQK